MARRWLMVLRGLLAAVALGVVVVVVPILLVREVGWPLPTALPSWGEVSHTIATGAIADATIIRSLTVLVWLAWANFSSGVLVEAVAIARGRGAGRVVGIRTAQHLAANLLATVSVAVALLGRPTVAASAGPGDLRLAVATATAEQPPQRLDLNAHEAPAAGAASGASLTATGTPVDGEPPRTAPSSTVYEVQRGDTLWDIADRVHGDGMRWREIRDHNVGREQSDGSRIVPDTEELRAGWTLLVPVGGPSAPPVDASVAEEDVDADPDDAMAVVEQGDTLWDLADEHLDDPHRWPEIYQENRDDTQPDGGALIDPDMIQPGWVLDLPRAPAVETPPGEPTPVDEIIEMPGLPDDRHEDATPADAPTDAPSESPTTPAVAATDAPSGPPTVPDTGATVTDMERFRAEQVERPAASEQDDIALAPIAVGGTLAAGFVLTLDRLRRARRRRRQPYHRIPLPEGEEAAAERRLRAHADADAARLLDLALRELSGHHPTPRVVLVSHGPADVTVHLDSASDAPPGWHCHGNDLMWSRHRPVSLDSLQTHAGTPCRFPALVTVGELPAGRVGLLNLARTGCLHLDGEDHVVRPLLAAWALELATTPRADALDVATIGFAGPSADLERITHLDDPSQLSDLLSQPHSKDPISVPRTVVLAAGLPTDVNVLLRTTSEFRPDLVAVTADLEPRSGDWSLHLEPGGRARLEPDGTRFHVLALGAEAVPLTAKLIEQALHDPDQLVQFPEPDATAVPLDERGEDGEDEPAVRVEVVADEPATEVRVLGPVEVVGTVEPFRTNKAIELIVYLALHRTGAGADTLLEALWPEQEPRPARLQTEASRARKSLGKAPDGSPHLPDAKLGRYRLADSVGVDHERFTAEVVAARRDPAHAVEHLRAALMLVRGVPLSATTTEYAWATNEMYGLAQEVVDAAHHLAQLYLEAEQYDDAIWAAERGLLADLLAEVLVRDLMRASAGTGNTARVHAAMTRLRRHVAEDADGNDADDWLHPETVALFEALTGVPTTTSV